ncbi:UBC-like protein [Trametes versicolor FP-101664 SS1]|uniref:UBC-like protein n=1 Tax=Trametes versicolor (strain FP-101664) TaxID=717944 RepID=UPI0004622855|nr:UBC-like protein [Trametes versicolor FP-101664 SS1]EIW61329.1 UBC-like protein [Trametes versicolor FP-101664 SS1]
MLSSLVPSPSLDLSSPTKNRPNKQKTRTLSNGTLLNTDPSPALTRTAVSLEYASLRHTGHCPLGMYVTPSPDNLMVWDAVFFVHQGYYTDSILKFRLTFPPDYPERPPTVQFLTDVFHPLISQQDGTFNLAPRFRPWRPKEHHVFDVLHWVKAAFKKHALDDIKDSDCFNKEAYRLYHDTTSSFAALATQSSMLSQSASALFDRDHPSMAGKGTHSMQFRELRAEQLASLRAKLGLHDWEDVVPEA